MASRAQAVRDKCIDCCGGQPSEVRVCVALDCPLHRWRFGKELRPGNSYLIPVETATGKIVQVRVPNPR